MKNTFKYISMFIILMIFLTSCKNDPQNKKSEFNPENYLSNTKASNIDLNLLIDYIAKNLNIKKYSIGRFQLEINSEKIYSLSIDILNNSSKEVYIASYKKKDNLFKISPTSFHENNVFSKNNKIFISNVHSLINLQSNKDFNKKKYSIYYLSMLSFKNISDDFIKNMKIYSIKNKTLIPIDKKDIPDSKNIFLFKSEKKEFYICF